MYVRQAGFLKQPYQLFDAQFFGISPREATCLDPQQRLLLEVTQEAIDNAGLRARSLAGKRVGVFIGGFMLDYYIMTLSKDSRSHIVQHTSVGNSMTLLSARLAYTFDFRGPTLSIDTACSSSLVATHYACQSLWNDECEVALIGGVNFILMPSMVVALCKAGLLSPDARCKAFDASANGYVRSEGAGVVLVKPLSRAQADGNPICALIRGSAVNQDGHSEGGITTPSPEAQEALLRAAYANASVAPADVQYVEAHGTGTAMGDVIETGALGAVLGEGRAREIPCLIGSIKSNLGHLEGAAGVAGLIKASLSLQRGQVPPNLHFRQPNPKIDFAGLKLRVCDRLQSWPDHRGPRLAGVNSFGYGGTNAHVVLEGYDAPPARATAPVAHRSDEGPWLLPLSARGDAARRALAQQYGHCLSEPDGSALSDVAFSAAAHRDHHEWRIGVVASSAQECVEALDAVVRGGTHPAVQEGRATGKPHKMVWVFTGMGPQWHGMGAELLRQESVFHSAMERADRTIRAEAGWSLLEELSTGEARSRMAATQVAQPANVAIQAALSDLWRSWGLTPQAIVGHSIGELGAAYAAGVLGLEEAVALGCHRGMVLAKAAGKGAMLAVGLSVEEAEALLRGRRAAVSIGAINGPTALTLSGDAAALKLLSEELTQKDVFNRFLRVEVPYHSPVLDPLIPEFRERAKVVRPNRATVPLYSTVTGRLMDGPEFDADYWCCNMRAPVLFAPVIDELLASHHDLFVEVGPHPVLADSIGQCAGKRGTDTTTLPTLIRNKPERRTVLGTLARLYAMGAEPRWERLFPEDARFVSVPSYPWQRQRHWHESPESLEDRLGSQRHPLLGRRSNSPFPGWDADLNFEHLPFIAEHRITGEVVMPGAAFMEAAVAMMQEVYGEGPCVLEEVEISSALVLAGSSAAAMHCSLDRRQGSFAVHSRATPGGTGWSLHCSGSCSRGRPEVFSGSGLNEVRARCEREKSVPDLYARLSARGYQYGPTFRQIERLWMHEAREILTEIHTPEALNSSLAQYNMHPATLDACLHTLLASLPATGDDCRLYVPVKAGRIAFHHRFGARVWCSARLREISDDALTGDIQVFDENGRLLLQIDELSARAVSRAQSTLAEDIDRWFFRYAWEEVAPPSAPATSPPGRWLLLGDGLGNLCGPLTEQGQVPIWACDPNSRDVGSDNRRPVDRRDRQQLEFLLRELASATPPCRGIVFEVAPGTTPQEAMEESVALLAVIQAATAANWSQPPRLWVVTRGAESALPEERVTDVGAGFAWGMGRVLMNEHGPFRVTLVDMVPDSQMDLLGELLLADPEEAEEVALRGDKMLFHRLVHEDMAALDRLARRRLPASGHWLALATATSSEGEFRETPHGALDREELQIGARAWTVWRRPAVGEENDVRGRSGSPLADVALAIATVEAVGDRVDGWRAGDEVLALTVGPAQTRLNLSARRGVRVPAGLSTEDAACALAVAAALRAVDLARVQAGERVLVHLGPEGVGLAAVQLVKGLGAHVAAVTTAELPLKECPASVPLLCADLTTFGKDIEAFLQGGAFDVILDLSLAAPETSRFISHYLSSAGRLLVLTHTAQRPVAQRARVRLNSNAAFLQMDFPALVADQPELCHALLSQAVEKLGRGEIQPLAPLSISASKLGELLAAALNQTSVAPLLLTLAEQVLEVSPPPTELRFPSDGTYLITGGLGGLGLAIAEWMVDRGARNLLLLSRRGISSPESAHAVERLRARGVHVVVAAADVTQIESLRALMSPPEGLAAIRGVVHLAGEFSFEFAANLTADQLRKLTASKTLGAWNLHLLTERLALDLFVLVSSVSAALGPVGASAYAAANAFLNSLATFRRGRGLPGSSLMLGAIDDVGVVSRNKQYERVLSDMGFPSMPARKVIECMGYAMQRNLEGMAIFEVDWERMASSWARRARFSRFLGTSSKGKSVAAASPSMRSALAVASIEDRPRLLASMLRELVAVAVGTNPAELDLEVSLKGLGIDSLMATQLSQRIERQLGLPVQIMTLMRGPSINELVKQLLPRLAGTKDSQPMLLTQVDSMALSDAVAAVESMSEAELRRAQEGANR